MGRRGAKRLQVDLYGEVDNLLSKILEDEGKRHISKTDTVNRILKYGCERKIGGKDLITLERIEKDISDLKTHTFEKIETLESCMSEILKEIKGYNGKMVESLEEMKVLRNQIFEVLKETKDNNEQMAIVLEDVLELIENKKSNI